MVNQKVECRDREKTSRMDWMKQDKSCNQRQKKLTEQECHNPERLLTQRKTMMVAATCNNNSDDDDDDDDDDDYW